MRDRLLWFILAVIAVALVLLMVNDRSGTTFGVDNDRFGTSVYLALWGLVVAAGLFASRQRLGDMARSMVGWGVILLVLVGGYQYRYELQDVASRVTAGLVPGSPLSTTDADGRRIVTLEKLSNGHFGARAQIDGTTIPVVVDTGATRTVLSYADATRAGIDTSALAYAIPVMTANGRALAATATVDEIAVGTIVRRHMRVLVAAEGSLDASLLGMDFIGSLSSFEMRGDRMILRD